MTPKQLAYHRAKNHERYWRNHEQTLAERRAYYAKVKDRAHLKRMEPKERARIRDYNRMYLKKNRARLLDDMKKRSKALKAQILAAYGSVCQCCGETKSEFLSLDHPNKDGYRHRRRLGGSHQIYRELRKLGFPPGYRILCMNCNHSLGIHGYCPHQKA